MSNKHTAVLKENFKSVLKQWGICKLERVMRQERAKKKIMPETYEMCDDCGKIKLISEVNCRGCREAVADKMIKQKSWENRQRYNSKKVN